MSKLFVAICLIGLLAVTLIDARSRFDDDEDDRDFGRNRGRGRGRGRERDEDDFSVTCEKNVNVTIRIDGETQERNCDPSGTGSLTTDCHGKYFQDLYK